MLIAGSSDEAPIGFTAEDALDWAIAYDESPSCYVLEVDDVQAVQSHLGQVPMRVLGVLNDSGQLLWDKAKLSVSQMTRAWRAPLDW